MTYKELTKVYVGDELGAYEFDDGTVLFWTSGRGGFVVCGGLGIWPPGDDFRERMREATKLAEEQLYRFDESSIELGETGFNHPDLIQKAREASQADPEHPSKYNLSNYYE